MKNGITLVALIITIIVLVILAAVSISAIYNSNIVNYAVNGATNYASEATRENEILDQTASIIESAVDRISDIAGGGSSETPEEPIKGIDFGNLNEDEKNEMIGKYVDYTPVSGSFTSEGQYNGGSDQPFSTISDLKWKILDTNNDTLTLISDKVANTNFTLNGANGYNNGVLLLNSACKAMYSNNNLGATGRSLNIDDIENFSTYSRADSTEYSPIYKDYPVIFEKELNGAPNGTYGTELDLSNQDEYITGTATGNGNFKGKWTYYSFEMSTTTMHAQSYIDLFNSSTTTWLASRCVNFSSSDTYFRIFYITNVTIDAHALYISNNYASVASNALRPVVEIDLSKVYVGETGSGADGDAYSIVAR